MTPPEPELALSYDGSGPIEPLDPLLIAEALTDLAARQERLEEFLTDQADTTERENQCGRWTWRYLDQAAAEALMLELREWVEWLVHRYQLQDDRHAIEPCWADHPVAVEELTALMVAWKAEFGPGVHKPSVGAISWHANWLWPTLERVNQFSGTRTCRSRGHREAEVAPADV